MSAFLLLPFFILLIQKSICDSANQKTCPTLSVIRGHSVLIPPVPGCTLSLYGENQKRHFALDGTIEGRWYGLLVLDCPDCHYLVYSKLVGCDNCTLCYHDELIINCRSILIPTLLGVSFTIIFCLLLYLIYTKVGHRLPNPMHALFHMVAERRSRKVTKRRDFVLKLMDDRLPNDPFPPIEDDNDTLQPDPVLELQRRRDRFFGLD